MKAADGNNTGNTENTCLCILCLSGNLGGETARDDGGFEQFDKFLVSFVTYSVSPIVVAVSLAFVALSFLIFMSFGSSICLNSAGTDLLIDSFLNYFAILRTVSG